MDVVIRRLLLDVLKPRETVIIELARAIGQVGGVAGGGVGITAIAGRAGC